MRADPPPVRDLVLVGGGHSHVQVLKALAMAPLRGVRTTLVSREVHTPYSGMLPGLVAGHYAYDDVHIDLGPLCVAAGARLIADEAMALDLVARRVDFASRPSLRFDILSLNSGGVPGADGAALDDSVVRVKPISGFLTRWRSTLEALEHAARHDGAAALAVVGAGAGGVELILAIEHALAQRGIGCALSLVNSASEILPGYPRRVQNRFRVRLSACAIDVVNDFEVRSVRDGVIEACDGRRLNSNFVLWSTGVAAPDWAAAAGLGVDDAGFIRVDRYLRSVSHPFVFATGDVASLASPRPKAGVFAVRAGAILAKNLRHVLMDRRLEPFRPQRRFLSLISEGERRAVASKGLLYAEGQWVWRWKDRIDRSFMERFQVRMSPAEGSLGLPPGLAADVPDAMRCGGCGAKLGGDLLARVLRRLDVPPNPVLIRGIGDDAAVIGVGDSQVLATVDGFRSPIDDPFRFGRIAVQHALGDVYAMGGQPAAALVWATVPLMGEALMEDELHQVMKGVLDALTNAGVALAGGHSSEGTELALGIAVLGQAPARPLAKGDLGPGDVLVLTKPLGSGVVLAGRMRGRARSRDVEAALSTMEMPNASALEVLRRHAVTGCTDVTGFGLLGHLGEMLRAAEIGAEVEVDRVPALPGALALIEQGVESSLAPSNALALADFDCVDVAANDPCLRLLIDPQTSGGLLAGIPESLASQCVADLRELGYPAAAIGRVRSDLQPGHGKLCRHA